MKFLQKYLERMMESEEDSALQTWKERCLLFILLSIGIAALPPLIKSLIRSVHDGLWLNGISYLAAYLINLILIFYRGIPRLLRAWLGVTIFIFLGILSVISIGPAGSGRVWLFTASIITTLVLGIKAGVFVLILQVILMFYLGYNLDQFMGKWQNFMVLDLDIWVTTSITFLFLSIISIVGLGGLIRGLSVALDQSSKSRKQLLETTHALNNKIREHEESKTLLMESEERWAFALEGAGDGVWDWDLNTDIAYFSPRWKEILGYGEKELGNEICIWLHKIHKQDKPFVLDAIEKSVTGDFTGFQDRYRMKMKDGTYIWVMNRGRVMTWDNEGRPHRIIGTLSDISFIKKLEDEKIEYEVKLQQVQKMEAVGALAGGIAHDFNNILTPVLGHTELAMTSQSSDPDVKENLKEIYAATLRAKELVRQILSFSRQDVVEVKSLNVVIVVKEVLKLLRSSIPSSITIYQNLDPDCGMIKGDPTQIHQVIMNLMTNAYQAMETTGGEITVTLVRKEVESDENSEINSGSYACLIISDTGGGIDDEVKDKIFEPFFTTKEKGRGTGLGLPVVLGIIQAMGGHLELESRPGKGTDFRILLPVIAENGVVEKSGGDVFTHHGAGHILLVDDEKNVLKVQKNILNFLGYTVDTFAFPKEALEAFERECEKYDLVITDMEMPELSGGKLAEKIKKIRPDIPLMLCSGFSEKVSQERLFSENIDTFLVKPVSISELSRKLRELLA